MADFRKVILVLAVLAIVAAPASAQLACTARATPTQLRVEGVTELVGDTTMSCQNTLTRRVSIEAIVNDTNITNRIEDAATNEIDAFLIINGNVAGAIPGRLGSGGTSVVWEDIEVPAVVSPATQVVLRITNIRVNASAFLEQVAGNQVQQVTETILVSGTDVLDVQNNVVNVGTARRGLLFSTVEAGDLDAFTGNFQACTGLNPDAEDGTGNVTFRLRFQEGIANAFRTQADTSQSAEINPLGIGTVTNPTRLLARFTNVPTGVAILVSSSIGTDPTDVVATLRTTGVSSDTFTIGGVTYRRVTISGGSGSAQWNIEGGTEVSRFEQALMNVIVSFPANVTIPPEAGLTMQANVGGSFAPTTEDALVADEDSAIPRFRDTSNPQPVFSLVACVTNLLFPFVTNQAGFDTGIALVNTSTSNATGSTGTPANQPFNTTPQTGTCTLYYFGSKADGTTPPIQTTVPIGANTTSTNAANKFFEAFALSSGGPAGATGSVAGFQGYLIARCNFQFGHGYAFITDLGAQRLAQGYLALVIPDRGGNSRLAQNFTVGTTAVGEQLVF